MRSRSMLRLSLVALVVALGCGGAGADNALFSSAESDPNGGDQGPGDTTTEVPAGGSSTAPPDASSGTHPDRPDAGAGATTPDASTSQPRPPSAPTADDTHYTVALSRHWLMAGDPLTPKDATFTVSVQAPTSVHAVDVWVDSQTHVRLTPAAGGQFSATLAAPAIGAHVLLFAADAQTKAFARRDVFVSAALYAVVSTDWDDSDNDDAYLANIETLRSDHPALVMTQFFAPYVFTDPDTTAARKKVNIEWMKQQRDAFGDEVGLHIHPYCNFVTHAGVKCRSTPSFRDSTGDATGYTVHFQAYTQAEQVTLLKHAGDLFASNGFARPTSFRAGGWTADKSTMQALVTAGFTVDSSAFPADFIQDAWAGTDLATWNAKNWNGITKTSQPYHPSQSNIVASAPAPTFALLQVPDNGCLVDYMTGTQMIDVLDANWPGRAALSAPRVYQIGLHPPDFDSTLLGDMDIALSEVDKSLYATDSGPIRFATLGALRSVWP